MGSNCILLGLVLVLLVSTGCDANRQQRLSRIMQVADDVLSEHKDIRQLVISIHNDRPMLERFTFNPSDKVVLQDQGAASRPPICIGGITRGLTAILVQKLLTNTNYTWDTPVQEILGHKLVLPDSYRSDKLNLRDIFSMRSGLAGMDIVPLVGAYGRGHLLRKLRYIPEVAGFRERFVYNEVLFTLVDSVIEKLTDLSVEDAYHMYLLEPLGFKNAEFSWNASLVKDLAYSSLVQSASSLCIDDNDVEYLFRFLHSGLDPQNNKFLDKEQINELFQGVQPRGGDDPYMRGYRGIPNVMSFTRNQNAIGWITGQFGTHRIVCLDGSWDNHDQSLIAWIPDRNIGVFVAFPGSSGRADFAAKFLLAERILRMELTNYRSADVMRAEYNRKAFNDMKEFPSLVRFQTDYCPHHQPCGAERPLDEYEGMYRNYAFGEVKVAFNQSGEKKLVMEYGDAVYELIELRDSNNTFRLRAQNRMYYTPYSTLYRIPYRAKFKAADDDSESRIFSLTVSGFDRDLDPEFSLNPREPKYDGSEDEGEDGGDVECSACGLGFSALLIVSLSLLSVYL